MRANRWGNLPGHEEPKPYTSDSLDSSDPSDSSDSSDLLDLSDPNLASIKTHNQHSPPDRWYNENEEHVVLLDHVMSEETFLSNYLYYTCVYVTIEA